MSVRGTPAPNQAVEYAFGIIHKRALGLATGITAALFTFALTWFHILVEPANVVDLSLLSNYFYSYSVTPGGAFVGAFWAFVSGFVGGWFLAFTRNFVLAVFLVMASARSDLDASGDILDHI